MLSNEKSPNSGPDRRPPLPTTAFPQSVVPTGIIQPRMGSCRVMTDTRCSVAGLVQIMIFPAHITQDVVVMEKFNMKKMLDAIVKYRSDELWLVPRRFS